ncbi:MarR family winged helix-turn-helix transcriptional regulator [Sphingomonas sp. GlSt437]|uniref:MarR family winged helix-turn-helix transcriptional regulator n=1 Tax=Sphingomonas sp. GlSt437 TaxID=3389970 RepID=UPI003A88EEE5
MSDSIGFLISDVSRLLRKRFDERARLLGLTRPQWRTLSILKRHEGINQGRLAELLEIEPITVCRMIDRLEEAGKVERRRDPEDRRAWRIYLTDKARPLLDQIKALADEMTEEMMDGLTVDQREAMTNALETIRSNLGMPQAKDEAAHG